MKRILALLLTLIILFGSACTEQAEPVVSAEYTGKGEPQDLYRTFYEIYVGAFYDSNADGYGDLAGVLEKLDYVNDNHAGSVISLHATGIWLMPIFSSPSYHKYDATDYYSIDKDFGTMDDFTALAAECDERGISLLLDLAVNHTSSAHPWFVSACASVGIAPCGEAVCKQSPQCREHNPYCDWYNFAEAFDAGYHAVPNAEGWYYEGQFWGGMPDLNLDNDEVRAELLKIGEFWLDKGTDGFRLDAVTSYYTGNTGKNAEFLEWLYDGLREYREDVYLVGEAWSDGGTIASLYGSGIPSLFSFPLAASDGKIISSIRTGKGADLATTLVNWQRQMEGSNPYFINAPFLTNHDMVRSSGALMGKLEMQKQAAAVYLLMPGSPFIYYGEEIGMGGGSKNDESKRTPMVWSNTDKSGRPNPPAGAEVREIDAGVDTQLTDKDSLLRFYINTVRIRNKYPAIARGSIEVIDSGNSAVCAYSVTWNGDTMIVAHNLSDDAITVTLPDGYALLEILTALPKSKLPSLNGSSLTLPARTSAVLGSPIG